MPMLAAMGRLDASGLVPLGRAFLGLGLALWLGGGLAALRSTRAIFALAPSRREGGVYSGAVLGSLRAWQAAGVALVTVGAVLGVRGAGLKLGILAAAGFLASLPVDAAVRELRSRIGGSTDGLAQDDPRRKRWGRLHGASVLLLLAQALAAGLGLWLLLLRGR
jgi:hypothetical protein